MATFTSMLRPGKRARLINDIIRGLKAASLHRRGWVSSERLAHLLDVGPDRLATPLAHAEEMGLVELRQNDDGRLAIRLTKLSAPRADMVKSAPILNEIDDCPHRELVIAVASMGTTSPTIDDLAEHLGRGQDDLCAELVEASDAGLIDLWPDSPSGPAVVLSVISAQRLGLAISADRSKWIRIGQPEIGDDDPPRELTEADVTSEDGRSPFDDVADPIMSPPDIAIEAEAAEVRVVRLAGITTDDTPAADTVRTSKPVKAGRAWSEDRLRSILEGESLDGSDEMRIPRPNKLIGSGRTWPYMVPDSKPLRPWTGPKDGPCPACGGLRLNCRTVCIVCHNSGVQGLLDRIKTAVPPPDPRPVAADTVRTRRDLRGGI
jgi:hypothetical protein